MHPSARRQIPRDEPAFSNWDSQTSTLSSVRLRRSLSCVLRGILPVSIAARGIESMLLNFVDLLTLTRGFERRIWAHAMKHLAYLWRDGLFDEMLIHFAQLIVDHPS